MLRGLIGTNYNNQIITARCLGVFTGIFMLLPCRHHHVLATSVCTHVSRHVREHVGIAMPYEQLMNLVEDF